MYTKGEWKIVNTVDGPVVTDENNRSIFNRDTKEQLANCHLTVAAKSLLRGCEAALGYFQYMKEQHSNLTPDEKWLEPLRNAILEAHREA